MKDFRDLKVWHKAHHLTLELYAASSDFPSEENFGITSQMRRAAVSVPANIAEGCGRGSDRDLARYLQMAMGSASELEYHLLLARDLKLLDRSRHQDLESQTAEVKRMLGGFLQKLKAES